MKDSQPQVFLVKTLELWILPFRHPPDPEATCAMPPPRGLRTLMTHLRIESKLLVSRCCPCCVCVCARQHSTDGTLLSPWLTLAKLRWIRRRSRAMLSWRSTFFLPAAAGKKKCLEPLNLSQFPSPTLRRKGQQRLKFVCPARLVRRESSLTLENHSQKSFL